MFTVKPRIMDKDKMLLVKVKAPAMFNLPVSFMGEPAPDVVWKRKKLVGHIDSTWAVLIKQWCNRQSEQLQRARSQAKYRLKFCKTQNICPTLFSPTHEELLFRPVFNSPSYNIDYTF